MSAVVVEVEARITHTGAQEIVHGEPTYVVTAAYRARVDASTGTASGLFPCGGASCVRRSQVAQAVSELLWAAEETERLRSPQRAPSQLLAA